MDVGWEEEGREDATAIGRLAAVFRTRTFSGLMHFILNNYCFMTAHAKLRQDRGILLVFIVTNSLYTNIQETSWLQTYRRNK